MKAEPPLVSIDRLSVTINEWEEKLLKIRMMPVEEAAQEYVEFRKVFDYLDDVRDKWASVKDQFSKEILPKVFEDSNIDSSISLKSGYRVGISYKLLASIKDKIAGYQWLRDNGLGDIVTETVNASTLSSVAKTLAAENKSMPDDIFNVVTQANTSMTAIKKKD